MRDRETEIVTFLSGCGWVGALRSRLAGDASARRYERLNFGGRRAILMDSPPGIGEDPADFVKVAQHLRSIDLNAPEILHADLPQGFLLLEDFGDDTFARVLLQTPQDEKRLFALACDALVRVQAAPALDGLPALSTSDWAEAAMMSVVWYAYAITESRPDPGKLKTALDTAIRTHAEGPKVMILRDYHAENLMWLPDRAGLDRVGLLDFQMAQMGQRGYDLVSLLQDARRDVAPDTEAAIIARYCAATETDPAKFGYSYATLGVQRALRLLGVFARLCLVAGKPGYIQFIPRVWAQLQRNLAALDLADLRELCDSLLPEPNDDNLDKITRKCALHAPL
jgi:N-acetylmuramate 1-kinase